LAHLFHHNPNPVEIELAENGTPTGWENNDFIIQSSEAVNWTIVFEGRLSAVAFNAIGFANETWLAGAGGMVSSDGIQWARSAPMHGLTDSLAYGDGRWFGVSGNRISVWDSTPTGSPGRPPQVRSLEVTAVTYGQGTFLAAGERQYLQHSVHVRPSQLALINNGDTLTLAWGVEFSDYGLQSAPRPEGPYENVNSLPGITKDQLRHVVDAKLSPSQFFRLQRAE